MLKLFALLLMTFIMVSCGGGKSTATLSISRGMALANTSFSGGIYITGSKVASTETFIATILTGNTTNIQLSFGTWNLKVIGWDGSGLMQGTPYCKYISNYSFASEGQQLEITTSNAECFDGTFISGSNQHLSASAWKSLVINSCGTLYGTSDSSLLQASGLFNPCRDGSYPAEFKNNIFGSFKLVLVNQDIAGVRADAATSACFNANTGNSIKFPNRLPVTVRFYKDGSCVTQVNDYRFKVGLDFSQSPTRSSNEFDWAVTSDSVNFFVTVASGASRRGTTAFHSETPVFKCLDGVNLVPCTKYPSTGAGTYYVDPDKYAVIATSQTVCGAITPTSFAPTNVSCDVIDGKAYIGFKSPGTSTLTGTLTMNSAIHTIKVGNTTAGYANDHTREAYKIMKRALGFRNASAFDNSLQDDADEGDNQQIGFLDPAIYEISSMGAGGLFYEYYTQCTTVGVSQAARSYVKNGFTYSVLITGNVSSTPAYTAYNENPDTIGSFSLYDRKIIVKKLVGPSYETEKVIELSCDSDSTGQVNYVSASTQIRRGKMEEQRSYSYGVSPANKLVTLKKKVFWNTSSSDTSRFDVYRTKLVTNTSNTKQKLERNFFRVTKSDSDPNNDFKIHALNYEVVRDGSAYDESLTVNEIDGSVLSGVVSYSHKQLMDLKLENTTIGNIFNTAFVAELNKVQYGYRPNDDEADQTKVSSSGAEFIEARRGSTNLEVRFTNSGTIVSQNIVGTPENIATDISTNGLHKIAVTHTGTTINYLVVNNGTDTTGTLYSTQVPADLKASILDDGTFVIAFLDPGTNQRLRWSINGTTISNSPFTTYTHLSLDLAKDSSMIYLLHTRSDSLNTTQILDICKMNGSQSCGFNTIASKTSGLPFSYASITAGASNIYFTYIHNSIVHTLNVDSASLLNVSLPSYPSSISFSPYDPSLYTNLTELAALRTSIGTTVDVNYPYYSPTISGFEMKLIKLNTSTMDAIFTTGFSTIAN